MAKVKTGIAVFLVGAATVSIAVSVLLRKNPQIKSTIEQKTKKIIDVSKDTLETAQGAFEKISEFTEIVNDKKDQAQAKKTQAAELAYQQEWEKHIWRRLSITI